MSAVWKQVQVGLKKQLQPHVYQNWIDPIHAVEAEGRLCLTVPSSFHAKWLQTNYVELIKQHMPIQTEFSFEVRAPLKVIQGGAAHVRAVPPPFQEKAPVTSGPDAYEAPAQFDDVDVSTDHAAAAFSRSIPFITCSGQNMAVRGLSQFLQSRDRLPFNPFFLKAPPGMGKTAIVNAQTDRLQQMWPECRIGHISIPLFAQEMALAISENRMPQFTSELRTSFDVLVIDNLQFLEKKKKTQEEVLHLIEHYIRSSKPVVLLSQKSPMEMDIESSLQARFQDGVTLDISPLDGISQGQMLRQLAHNAKVRVPDALVTTFEKSTMKTVSDVIALWRRLDIQYALSGQWPSAEELGRWMRPHQRNDVRAEVAPEAVVARVCEVFKVTMDDIAGPARKQKISDARRVMVYLLRELSGLSLQAIGDLLNRNHSTVLHILDFVKGRCDSNPVFERQLKYIKDAL